MKKIINKIFFLSILIICAITLKSYAESTFNFYCDDTIQIYAGETVEVPVYIDGIEIETAEKKLIVFEGTISYDEDVFEIVPYVEDGNSIVFKPNTEELSNYGMKILDVGEPNKIKCSVDADHIQSVSKHTAQNYLNNFIKVGTIQVKAKDNAKPGKYDCMITNLNASNSEISINPLGKNTGITIMQKDYGTKSTPETTGSTDELKNTKSNGKKAVYNVKISDDGKKITFEIDEENGASIYDIKCNKSSLTEEDGNYVFTSEPGNTYEFFIYGANGTILGNEYVKVPSVTNTAKAGEKSNTKIVYNAETGEVAYGDSNKSSEDENKVSEDTNKASSNNAKKSPQTGDYISIVVGILATAMMALGTITIVRKRK